MTEAELQAEVERLRNENEQYRQRELADLRAALSSAREEAAHYRAEAQRNADVGRQIHSTAQETIATLRTQLEAQRTLAATRTRQHANN